MKYIGITIALSALLIGCAGTTEKIAGPTGENVFITTHIEGTVRTVRHNPTGRCFIIVISGGGYGAAMAETDAAVCAS